MTVLDDYFKALGKKSAAARMKNMTKAERREVARNAANARWAQEAEKEDAAAKAKGREVRRRVSERER